jgi:hypothetical protein
VGYTSAHAHLCSEAGVVQTSAHLFGSYLAYVPFQKPPNLLIGYELLILVGVFFLFVFSFFFLCFVCVCVLFLCFLGFLVERPFGVGVSSFRSVRSAPS